MILKRYIFSLAILAFLFSGCGNTPGIFIKTGAGDQTISAKSGKSFSISLEAQLSTGYSWKLQELPASLEIVKEDVRTDKKNVDITGGFEIQEFVFKSRKKEDVILKFNYAQHWKKTPVFEKTANVKVKVE